MIMDSKQKILAFLSGHKSAGGRELRNHLGISRQALNIHIRALIESGDLLKSGSTRGARYSLATRAPEFVSSFRDLSLDGLDESEVYSGLATVLNLSSLLPGNVEDIVRYSFTEMLNNSIEHSAAERCRVRVRLEAGWVSFVVRDRGIGVFHSIASKLNLDDEQAALVELLKGKTTTMAATHTGEGIFFSSRVADRFVLRSHRIQLEANKARNDIFVSQRRFIEGTDIRVFIRRTTRRKLEDVFGEFAPEEYDFQFQKTKVFVKFLRQNYVSRAEAKRLVVNLEKFTEIVLDFKDVGSIGQGFADEIFRVFAGRYPDITISAQNTNPVVEAMLRHVDQSRADPASFLLAD
jgi:biotin operon repressor/anti-sigma regulatory factor (Ser/Thr protein kinase)